MLRREYYFNHLTRLFNSKLLFLKENSFGPPPTFPKSILLKKGQNFQKSQNFQKTQKLKTKLKKFKKVFKKLFFFGNQQFSK